MYADNITASMQLTIDETLRRRMKQMKYNEEHNITPKQIIKKVEISQQSESAAKKCKIIELKVKFGS